MAGHGSEQVSFDDLNFHGRARSINGSIRHLERAVHKHIRDAERFGKDPNEVYRTTINQVERLFERLRREG